MPSGLSASHSSPMPNQQQQIATIEPAPTTKNGTSTATPNQQVGPAQSSSSSGSGNKPIPVVTCDFASDMSTSEAGAEEQEAYRDTLRVEAANAKTDLRTRLTPLKESSPVGTNGNADSKKLTIQAGGRNRALSVGVEIDAVSEFEPSSSDSGVVSKCAVVKPLKFRLCQPIFGKRILKLTGSKDNNHHQNGNKKPKSSKSKSATQTVALTPTTEVQPAKPKPRDPEKEKRRIARKKEKRATLILGMIMGSFIACWLP